MLHKGGNRSHRRIDKLPVDSHAELYARQHGVTIFHFRAPRYPYGCARNGEVAEADINPGDESFPRVTAFNFCSVVAERISPVTAYKLRSTYEETDEGTSFS